MDPIVHLKGYVVADNIRNKNDEDIPVYSVTHDKGFCTSYFDKDVTGDDKTSYKIVPRGHFAYNPLRVNVGSLGYQNVLDKVLVSSRYVVFKLTTDEIDPEYLEILLKSDMYLRIISALCRGSVRPELTIYLLQKVPIRLHSPDVQRHFVKTFKMIEDLIDRCDQTILLFDEMVKSRFVEMFGDRQPNSDFNECVKSMIKGPFGSDTRKNLFVPKAEGTYKVYIQANVIKRDQTIGDYFISKQYYDDKMYRFKVNPLDYIITCDGTMGKWFRLGNDIESGIISSSLLKISIDESVINPRYFESVWDFKLLPRLLSKVRNGCMQHLPSAKIIGSEKIILPLKDEQDAYADFVNCVNTKKSALVQQRNDLIQLSKSLQQKYFTLRNE